ncbi:calpain [Purpureocillium lavendulum]|uniref:Calpain n=1 Tax=Purpureocillium lavendulum TaxID=1247861 RepID=A0AB34G543_9HYPO|nr:calpain [Purpureocillium lavendulum]
MDTSPADAIGGSIPASAIQSRHLPRRLARVPRRTFNHTIRANAKHLAHGNDPYLIYETLGAPYPAGQQDGLRNGSLRPSLEGDLRRQYGAARPLPRQRCRNNPTNRSRLCGQDEDEGRDLARSEVPLPSDRFRLVRRPTLEREEAFRDATTAKGKVRTTRRLPVVDSNDDEQVAELYRMGLLYDDADRRAVGEDTGFNLNSIQHEQPVYSIRPAKRARKGPKSGFNLHLDLSFSDLGDDTAIAQFFRSGDDGANNYNLETTDDEDIQHSPRHSYPPLRVVYELAGSGHPPSFDVDTSQPPDLVNDTLSDYDCFSESDLDDTLSQREMRLSTADGHHASSPSDETWVVLGDDS